MTLGRVPSLQRDGVPLLTFLRSWSHRVRLEYEWLQRALLFHLRLSVVPAADSVVTAGELTVSEFPFRMATTRPLETPLSTAFAAAEQEQRKKDQDQYTTSNCTTDDVLLVV